MSTLHAYYANRIKDRAGNTLFLLVMNIILMTALVLWTALGLVLFPILFVFHKYMAKRTTSWITRWAIWVYGRVWQFFTRLFVTFEPAQYHGSQFTIPGIIVVNHRSYFDTYCMNMLPVWDVCFAVRDWPFKIPVYNIFMGMANYMNIEKFPWEKNRAISEQALADNGFVLFFPEGHRSQNTQMTRFHSGAFKMAVETGAPIIPVCLTGTEDLLPPNRRYMAPARIKMKVLDPVFPSEFSGEMKHQTMKKRVKEMMSLELASMDAHKNKQEKTESRL